MDNGQTGIETMTAHDNGLSSVTDLSMPRPWVRVLLGLVMILAGLFVLGDIAVASLLSAIFIGAMAIVAGGFEIVHAFWTKGWGGFIWQILLGALYVAFGVMMVSQPVAGALVLTYFLAFILLASGVLRILLAFRESQQLRWTMLISGVFGVIAGIIILAGWPASGLWVLGLLLGVDLIVHGAAWLMYGILPRSAQ
jgi:uncharacterized membrane protein HdeD (DUF308 family)